MNEYVKIKGVAKYVGLDECGIIRGAVLNVAIMDWGDDDIICQARTPSGGLIQLHYPSIYSAYKDWMFLEIEYVKEDF